MVAKSQGPCTQSLYNYTIRLLSCAPIGHRGQNPISDWLKTKVEEFIFVPDKRFTSAFCFYINSPLSVVGLGVASSTNDFV